MRTQRGGDEGRIQLRARSYEVGKSQSRPEPISPFPFPLPSHTRGGIEMNSNDSETKIVQSWEEEGVHSSSRLHIPKHPPSRTWSYSTFPGPGPELKNAHQRAGAEKLYRGISSHPLSMWRLSESARLKSFRQYRHLCNTGDVACTVS